MKKSFCQWCIVLLILLLSHSSSIGQVVQIPGHAPIQLRHGNSTRNASQNITASCTNDSVVLTRQSQIDSFPITNPGCTAMRYVTVDGTNASPAITRLDSLKDITAVTQWLHITHTSITDLSAMSSLTTVGILQVTSNDLMTTTSITTLQQIDLLFIDNNPALASLAGLTNNVTTGFGGTLFIGNTALTDLTGLEGLSYVGAIYIFGNHQLQSLQGLQNITASDYGITILGNDPLTDVSALGQITGIPFGTLECSYNNSLADLTGLGNINLIGGGFWFVGNGNLTSLSNLNANLVIQNDSQYGAYDSILIEHNWQLAVCSYPPICNFLNNDGRARINDNSPGCNDISEILASCLNIIDTCSSGMLKTWNGSTSIYWNDNNNWTPAGIPSICDTVLIPTGLTDYPQLDSSISIRGLTMEPGTSMDCQFAGHVIINGDFSIDYASIYFADSLIVNDPENVYTNHSNIQYGNNFIINNYKGPFNLQYCTIDGDVKIADDNSRQAPSFFRGNTINGNLFITANSADTAAIIYISNIEDDHITGNATFTINAPSHVEVGYADLFSKTFHTGGDLIINSNFAGYPALRHINFSNPSTPSHITHTGGAPLHIYHAGVSGIMLVLDQDVHIDHEFYFQSGRVRTAPDKLLVFENNASWYILNSGSYAWGPVKKIGNQPFYFPIGDSTNYVTFLMSAPANSTDAFTASYTHKNPSLAGYDTSLHASSLSKIFSREYWTFDRNNGNSKVKLQFLYDTTHTGPFSSPYDLRIANWDGSQWQNRGNAGVTPFGPVSGYIMSDSISSFGPFALAQAPHRLPVITITNPDTACASFATPFFVHFTVDTLMLSNNIFKLEISDSSGSFANPTQIGQLFSNHSDSIFAGIPGNFPYGNHYKIRIVGNAPPDTSAERTITVIPFPAGMVVHGPTLGCVAGGIYKYWVTPVQQGITYNWSLNSPLGTLTSNHDTAYVTWTTPGNLAVQVQNTNRCFNGGFAYLPVTVSPTTPTQVPVLTNTGRWLFSTAPAANQYALGYHWYRNDTLISGATNSSYYASTAGTYKVKYYNLCNEGPASNNISFGSSSLPQTINFPVISNKTFGDPDFVIPATASSGLAVSFTISSGPGSIPGNVYHITTTGTVTINATQPGDNSYDTAAPVNQTFTISKAAQTISFPVISDKDLTTTTQFGLLATSNSGLPILYSILSGPAIVSGTNVTLTGVGTVTIRATQAGDTNYLAAPAVDRSFCVSASALNPISGPLSICPGVNATYSVNNIAGATYTWRIAGGSTLPSTSHTVTTIWPSPGTYTLIASATGNCGTPSSNDSLTITAITSVQPDSVNTMLPANGAINQQLPLTLSWIPANPNLFYTYDIYIWRSDLPQPALPTVSNITVVNYTIPLNGLAYGQTYKWMVVAHNGSCTVVNGGPIQTFSLIQLPDLEVHNVAAPSTTLSGQPLSVTWKVKNNGPGNTQLNQHWTDAVFISVDSTLNFANFNQLAFPAAPLLVAIKPNISALNTGQSYDDTASFTTPVSYSGALYIHVITNYAPPLINPVIEITKANDTAHALPATLVTLSPQPDLRVDTVVNPNNTFSGSTIYVTYQVKNYNVNASGSWTDKIYVSKDAVFNINTATLLKYPNAYGTYYPTNDAFVNHSNGLQQDSSYTVSVPVIVPNFIYGSYYVYVFTNAIGQLYEGPNNNNNVNRGNLLQVFLTPTPKITPLTVSVSPNISTTQQVMINWPEQNQGAYDNLQANRGHYFVRNRVSPPCPLGYPYINYIDSLGFGSSYWIDRVYLSTDSTGLNLANASLLGEVPHGTLNSYSGLGAYTSQYCAEHIPPAENVATSLLPNTNYPAAYQYQVPANLAQGDYYIYVYANPTKTVYEYPGTPQIVRSSKITVSWPDLTVPSVTVPPTANSGQPLTINYSVLNAGPGAVYNHFRKDYIYMGNSSTFNGSAVLLDSVMYAAASVPVNTPLSLQKIVTIPNGVSGSKFFFIRANGDSTFKEITQDNNTNASGAAVTINLTPAPDLQVSSIAMADTVSSVFGFPFKYTITNNGPGLASGVWRDSIFFSCNNTFSSSGSYFAGVRIHQDYLPAGGSYSDSFSLVVPMTFLLNNTPCLAGDTVQLYFYVKTNSNNGLYEPAANNNITGTNQKTVTNPFVDHIVTDVSSADSTATGQYFKVNWTVKNLGYNPNNYTYGDPIWYDNLFISPDSILNGNTAVQIGYKTAPSRLNHNQDNNDSLNALIPNLPSGYYYLFANANCYNRIYAERNLANNNNLRRNGSGQPLKIYITNTPAADLTDSILTAVPVTAVGQPVKIVYRVKNSGQSITNTGNWNDELWLSNNFQIGGLFLGTRNHNGVLLPGQSYTDSFTVNIPVTQPQGNYTLVVRTSRDFSVYETDYNNNLAFRFITVYAPLPTDLVVNNITSNDTLILGKSAAINWDLGNISNNLANGFETDGIYLSDDSLINSNNDILIGTKQNLLTILPLGSASQTAQPGVSGVIEGNYFLKVKTDILNNILETNRLNNTGIRSNRVYVKVNNLPMNIVTPDTLQLNYLYYKLVVPAALQGKTIQVKLTSNDSLVASNQLYIGLGYLPSAAHFDYTYGAPSYGNQQIVIESVVDSVYYIAVKGAKPGNGNQLISLRAIELPFALTTVTANRGGNTGNVTILVKGSLFTTNMIARIHGVALNNNISASAIYFINSTTAYVTFNLSGKPLGLYDVILKKPDSSAAILPASFTIEQTNNGGLITGSGPNTGQVGSGNAPGCDPGASSGLNAQLQTELIIPPKVFASWPFSIQINYTNTTNVDIPAQVKILYSLDGAPLSLTEAGLSEGKTSLYIEFKDATGPPNIIRAGGTGTIKIYSKAPLTAAAHSFLNYTFQ